MKLHYILIIVVLGALSWRPMFHQESAFVAPESYLRDAFHKEIQGKDKLIVDLYVMSQCPYGIKAEETLIPILKEAGDKVDFRLHFIGNEKADHSLTSLHGQPEVDENRRQLVISRHFPDKFLEYLSVRTEDYYKDDCSEALHKVGLDKAAIDVLIEKQEEINVYRENIALGNVKRIYGSPSLFINGTKYKGSYKIRKPKKVKKVLNGDGTCNNDGSSCEISADCPKQCVGGSNPGTDCTAGGNSVCKGTCSGGFDDGNICSSNAECRKKCIGGVNDGIQCGSDANCPDACTGGPNDGMACTGPASCPSECDGGLNPGDPCTEGGNECLGGCDGGVNAGDPCSDFTDCPGGCQGGADEGDECIVDVDCTHACENGAEDGAPCTVDAECDNACQGGANDGGACTVDAECPNACQGGANDGAECVANVDCPGECSDNGAACINNLECNPGANCINLGTCPNVAVCGDIGTCTDHGTCGDPGNCVDDGSCDVGACDDPGICDGNGCQNKGSCVQGTCVPPLPVEMISFKVKLRDNKVLLVWKTATEQVNEGFEIQHSIDGITWELLEFVEGNGTTNEQQTYSWTHERPGPGLHYYRLNQYNYNGQSTLMETKAIEVLSDAAYLVQVFPNPTHGSLTIYMPSKKEGKSKISVLDSQGKIVKTITRYIQKGDNVILLDWSDLPNGTYQSVLEFDREIKMIKQVILN